MTKTTIPTLHPLGWEHLAGTRHEDIHSTAIPALVEVLASTPGYDDTRRMFERLDAYQPAHAEDLPDDPLKQATDLILKALQDGAEIPTDLYAKIEDPESIRRRAQAAMQAKPQAMSALRAQLDQLVPIPRVWDAASKALVQVCEEAKELHQAGAPRTADDAIASNRVADFKRVQEVEERYAELRRMQQSAFIANVQVNGDNRGVLFIWYVRDLSTILSPESLLLVTGERDNGGMDLVGAGSLPENWNAASAVWWFAETGATPWMPTRAEQKAERSRIQSAIEAGRANSDLIDAKASRMGQGQASSQIQMHRQLSEVD